jgi:hypothetical protein
MKLRKFNDFKRIYENNPGLMTEPGEPGELEMSGTTEQPQISPPIIPVRREREQPKRKVEPDKIEQPSKDPKRKAQSPYEEEEMGGSQIDTMLQNVVDGLQDKGAIMKGNVIEVEGNKIDFISELMCFSINDKPMKNLTTAEQVIDFIQSGKHMAQRGAQVQRKPQAQGFQRMQTQTQTPGTAPSLTGVPGGGQRNPITPGQPMQERYRRKY